MIIEALVDVVFKILKKLFFWMELDPLPAGASSVLDDVFYYLEQGYKLILYFCNETVLSIALAVVLGLVAFKYTYKFIYYGMHMITKIKNMFIG